VSVSAVLLRISRRCPAPSPCLMRTVSPTKALTVQPIAVRVSVVAVAADTERSSCRTTTSVSASCCSSQPAGPGSTSGWPFSTSAASPPVSPAPTWSLALSALARNATATATLTASAWSRCAASSSRRCTSVSPIASVLSLTRRAVKRGSATRARAMIAPTVTLVAAMPYSAAGAGRLVMPAALRLRLVVGRVQRLRLGDRLGERAAQVAQHARAVLVGARGLARLLVGERFGAEDPRAVLPQCTHVGVRCESRAGGGTRGDGCPALRSARSRARAPGPRRVGPRRWTS
jgi:hypothetical protein